MFANINAQKGRINNNHDYPSIASNPNMSHINIAACDTSRDSMNDVLAAARMLGVNNQKEAYQRKFSGNEEVILSKQHKNNMFPAEKQINFNQGINQMLGTQHIHDAMQEDYEAYKCPHNPFISVDVSGPFWNNEGG